MHQESRAKPWPHPGDALAAAAGGGDGADSLKTPGWGHRGVWIDPPRCSWSCAKMSGSKAWAVKKKSWPQQGKINIKVNL